MKRIQFIENNKKSPSDTESMIKIREEKHIRWNIIDRTDNIVCPIKDMPERIRQEEDKLKEEFKSLKKYLVTCNECGGRGYYERDETYSFEPQKIVKYECTSCGTHGKKVVIEEEIKKYIEEI